MNRVVALAVALAFAASPALAHVGLHAESGFAAGLAHPFTGLDHLLAMVAVGLWAGLAFPRAPWACPAAFVTFMLGGFALGFGGAPLAGVEGVILASVVVLGLAVAARLKLPTLAGCAIVGLFALTHGYAHGQEAPAAASRIRFAMGFTLATIALHLAGLGLAAAVQRLRAPRLAQAAGLGVAATGLALAWLA